MSIGDLSSRREARRVDDDHPLARLLAKMTKPTLAAMNKVTDYDHELLLAGAVPWTAPLPLMTVMHGFWLVSVHRQMIQQYTDAAIKMLPRKNAVPPEVTSFIQDYVARIDDLELATVRLESQHAQGLKLRLAEPVPLPTFLNSHSLSFAVWNAYSVLHQQLRLDEVRIAKLGVPRHFEAIQKEFKDLLIPTYRQFDVVRERLSDNPTVQEYDEAIKDVRPLADLYFTAGQGLWAPYLLGNSYRDAMRYKPTLDDLNFGFDVWCLTDPAELKKRTTDDASRQTLYEFWKKVKRPVEAARLQAELAEALKTRRLRRQTNKQHSEVPWQSLYLVRFPITFSGREFASGDQIVIFPKETPGGYELEVRRNGRLTHPLDLLGQR